MSEIKLPVTVLSAVCGRPHNYLDADGQLVAPEEIAAALNAAPVGPANVNAFDGNSLYGLFIECGQVGDDPEAVATIMKEGVARLLAELDTAPVAPDWRSLGKEGASGTVFFGHSKSDGLSIWVLVAVQDGESWYECVYSQAGHSEDLPTVTHWIPLPAAPEAQGGPDHG